MAEVVTPQMRIERALRVIAMLGNPPMQVDVVDILGLATAVADVLVAKGIATRGELEAAMLEARAQTLESMVNEAQVAARTRSNVGAPEPGR